MSAQLPAAAPYLEVISPGRFAGETVIVTGAAAGIGRAVALRAVLEGARVIAADKNGAGLTSLVREPGLAKAPRGAGIVPVAADITNEQQVRDIIGAAGGKLHAVVNNAGIMDDFGAAHEVTDEMWHATMDTNVTGALRVSRAALPLMLAAHHGRIVNVTSVAGMKGSIAGAAYTASKHALAGLTKSMAVMYLHQGIRVNAVAPGATATGIQAPGFAEFGGNVVRGYLGNIPAVASPAAVAASILFLASRDSGNVNGSIMYDDGGWAVL